MTEEQVLNTHNAEILLSAANKSHYPQDDLQIKCFLIEFDFHFTGRKFRSEIIILVKKPHGYSGHRPWWV